MYMTSRFFLSWASSLHKKFECSLKKNFLRPFLRSADWSSHWCQPVIHIPHVYIPYICAPPPPSWNNKDFLDIDKKTGFNKESYHSIREKQFEGYHSMRQGKIRNKDV